LRGASSRGTYSHSPSSAAASGFLAPPAPPPPPPDRTLSKLSLQVQMEGGMGDGRPGSGGEGPGPPPPRNTKANSTGGLLNTRSGRPPPPPPSHQKAPDLPRPTGLGRKGSKDCTQQAARTSPSLRKGYSGPSEWLWDNTSRPSSSLLRDRRKTWMARGLAQRPLGRNCPVPAKK